MVDQHLERDIALRNNTVLPSRRHQVFDAAHRPGNSETFRGIVYETVAHSESGSLIAAESQSCYFPNLIFRRPPHQSECTLFSSSRGLLNGANHIYRRSRI